uniref:Transmembrane protein n=3 Tax=Cucumis sativus TaxID=3659 RepID=A0A0A0KU94_CUCSA
MLLPSQNLFRCSNRLKLCSFTNSLPRNNNHFCPSFSSLSLQSLNRFHFHAHKLLTTHNNSTSRHRIYCHYGIGVYESEDNARSGDFNLESVLLLSEFIFLFSSAVFLVVFVLNFVGSSSKKGILMLMGDRGLVWGFPLLVATVVLNSWIRRLQWRRISWGKTSDGLKVNLLDRFEKLEEDLKSLMIVIRGLSRKLEKLGIRYMVTRKTLKDPIAETAVLAQINSEDTRTLAVQEDILEKEFLEMQKVLLAMQEQQQKQLELIVAMGEKRKLMESKQTRDQEQTRIDGQNSANVESKELEAYEI